MDKVIPSRLPVVFDFLVIDEGTINGWRLAILTTLRKIFAHSPPKNIEKEE
jgi:hypothetical protein